MTTRWLRWTAGCLLSGLSWFAPASVHAEQVTQVTLCEVLADPQRYDHQLLQLTGHVRHGFEEFTLSAAGCPKSSLWLEYGGKRASGTMYCCGVTDARWRPKTLVVEGIATKLVDDAAFRQFDRAIQHAPEAEAQANATVIGRFFAGTRQKFPTGYAWVGYGHFGLFSLLVIQQVLQVKPS